MRQLTALLCTLLLVFTASFSMVAIAQEDDDSDSTAAVRVGHFASDAPRVDIYLDGEAVIEDLAYTQVTPFLALPAGMYEVAVVPVGADIEDAVIGPLEVDFSADTNTTVAAVGTLENETLTATIFTEDYDPLQDNRAGLTVFHAIDGEGAVNIIGSGTQLVDFLRYPDLEQGFDGAFTRTVPAGLYDLSVQVDATGVIVRAATDVPLADGQYYLVVALGTAGTDGDLLVVTPEGNLNVPLEEETPTPDDTDTTEDTATIAEGIANLRVGHFAPDAPNVDIFIDGELTVGNLAFTSVTQFLELPSGTYEIAIAATGDAVDDERLIFEVTLEADTHTTIGAIGSIENDSLDVTVFTENYGALSDGTARITVLHTIENEREINVYGSTVLLIQVLRYPNAELGADGAFTRDVPAGRYNLSVRLAEANLTIRSTTGVELEDGEYYLIVALGPQSEEGDLLIVPSAGNLESTDSE
ncbi:MAG: DUF4397 domain-containing protein [Chloroflexota bacterium]